MKRFLLLLCFSCLPGFVAAQTSAVPNQMSYQGRVTDAGGALVGSPVPVSRTIVFRVWNHASATTAINRLWSEQQTVTIANGEFSVLIGAGSPLAGETNTAANFGDIFSGNTCFLSITIDDGNPGTVDPEISPRQQIVTTPFAFRAKVAEAVASGAISNAMLANNAVSTAQLADVAVTTGKLAAGAVTTTQIAAGAVTAANLAPNAVDGTKIAAGSIALANLAPNSVDGTKLVPASIALSNLGPNSVDSSKIVDGSVALADHAPNSIDSSKIIDGSIALADHAVNSVDGSKIVDGSVGLADLATGSVDATKIVAGSVGLNQLDAVARAGLPKARHIYNQAISTDYTTARTKGATLIPIDIGELGNDVDGCRLMIIMQHRVNPSDWRTSDVTIYLTQPGFTNDANFPNLIWGRSRWVNGNGVGSANFRLNVSTVGGGDNSVGWSEDNWVQTFTFYPGSLRGGEAPPFNQNQDNNASNANAGGPTISLAITSIQVGANKLTITTDNPHAIQVGDTVTLSGVGGVPDANGARTVTAQNDRTSFEISLPNANTGYANGSISHKPRYNKFRIWAAVHSDVSARIIVSDR